MQLCRFLLIKSSAFIHSYFFPTVIRYRKSELFCLAVITCNIQMRLSDAYMSYSHIMKKSFFLMQILRPYYEAWRKGTFFHNNMKKYENHKLKETQQSVFYSWLKKKNRNHNFWIALLSSALFLQKTKYLLSSPSPDCSHWRRGSCF